MKRCRQGTTLLVLCLVACCYATTLFAVQDTQPENSHEFCTDDSEFEGHDMPTNSAFGGPWIAGLDDFDDIDLDDVEIHHEAPSLGKLALMWLGNKMIVIYLILSDMYDDVRERVREWR